MRGPTVGYYSLYQRVLMMEVLVHEENLGAQSLWSNKDISKLQVPNNSAIHEATTSMKTKRKDATM
jgi:hypothetical protein